MLVLVPSSVYDDLRAPAAARVPDARLIPYDENPAVPVPDLPDADAVLRWFRGQRWAELVRNGPKVRWLHTESAGVDHILMPGVADKPGLVITDSGPAYEIAIAEFVLAWMLMAARRLPTLLEQQRAHEWRMVEQEELHGQTVGVVGLGPIGRGIARRCQALGMRTLGLRRRPEPVEGVNETLTGADGLARLLAESDWLVLAAALTGETRHIVGEAELARMKPTARLVNIARGAMVDEPALIDALRAGRLAGAFLDVFAQEPLPPDSPLWDMPNVSVSPHTSPGWSPALRARQRELFLANLERFARGEPLADVVDAGRGY